MNSTTPAFPLSDVRFFFTGDDYFDAVVAAIDGARDEILVEVYIYDWDQIGQRLIAALGRARARKVDVHLMVDGVGSLASLERLQAACDEARIDFRVYHPPLFFSRLMFRPERAPLSRRMRAFFTRLMTLLFYANKRNHRKSVVIDGRVAFIGSFNVTDVHSARAVGPERAWRDTGVRLEAPPATLKPLIAAFQRAWIRSRDLDRPRWRFRRRVRRYYDERSRREDARGLRRERRLSLGIFRLNDTLRRRMRLIRDLRRRLRRARRRILITNAYFLPRPALLRLLRAAARRGVFVGLVLPAKTDVWMVREAGRTMLRKLIKDGVHVFEYEPVVLHAKTMVIDDWSMVGSHNLNHRSLIHDLEVDVMLERPEDVQRLVAQWDLDVRAARALTLKDLDSDSALRRLVGRLVYLVRYWM